MCTSLLCIFTHIINYPMSEIWDMRAYRYNFLKNLFEVTVVIRAVGDYCHVLARKAINMICGVLMSGFIKIFTLRDGLISTLPRG